MAAHLIAILSSPLDAQVSWVAPYDTSAFTMGGVVEQRFTEMMKACIGDVRSFRWASKLRSRVPSDLQAMAMMADKVELHDRAKTLAYLLSPYSSPAVPANFNVTDILKLPTDDEPQLVADPNADAVTYLHDCQSVMALALKAQADFGRDILSAALRATLRADKASSLLLVSGHFLSPLASKLSATAPSAERLAMLLNLWLWYKDHERPAHADATYYYMHDFEGAALANALRTARATRLEGTSATNLGFVFGSFSAQARAKFGDVATLDGQSYITMFRVGRDDTLAAHFRPLPSPTAIQNEFRLASLMPDDNTRYFVVKGTSNDTRVYRLSGIPRSMCEKERWRLTTAPALGDLAIASAAPAPNTPLTCTFQLSFSPPESLFVRGKPLEFAFKLTSTVTLGRDSLSLDAPLIRLSTEETPRVFAKTDAIPMRTVTPGAGAHDRVLLKWTTKLTLYDPNALVEPSKQITVKDQTLSCGGRSFAADDFLVQSAILADQAGNKTAMFEIKLSGASTDAPFNAEGPLHCQYNGVVSLATVAGTKLDRAIPLQDLSVPFFGSAATVANSAAPSN